MRGASGRSAEQRPAQRGGLVGQVGSTEIKLLFFTNVALQLFDAHLTLRGLGHGYLEGNPFIQSAVESMGPVPGVFAAKIFAICCLAAVHELHFHARPWMKVAVATGLATMAAVYTTLAIVPWTMFLARVGG